MIFFPGLFQSLSIYFTFYLISFINILSFLLTTYHAEKALVILLPFPFLSGNGSLNGFAFQRRVAVSRALEERKCYRLCLPISCAVLICLCFLGSLVIPVVGLIGAVASDAWVRLKPSIRPEQSQACSVLHGGQADGIAGYLMLPWEIAKRIVEEKTFNCVIGILTQK